jgi:hypothetical protein
MNRFPSRPSRSARRNAEIWTVRFAGSTNVFDQTRAINSCLLTSSLGRSSKTMSISSARLPRGTGLSPLAEGVVPGVTGRIRMRFPSASRRQICSSTTAGRYPDFEHRVSPRSLSQNEIAPAAPALREISPTYQQRLPSCALFACPPILELSQFSILETVIFGQNAGDLWPINRCLLPTESLGASLRRGAII